MKSLSNACSVLWQVPFGRETEDTSLLNKGGTQESASFRSLTGLSGPQGAQHPGGGKSWSEEWAEAQRPTCVLRALLSSRGEKGWWFLPGMGAWHQPARHLPSSALGGNSPLRLPGSACTQVWQMLICGAWHSWGREFQSAARGGWGGGVPGGHGPLELTLLTLYRGSRQAEDQNEPSKCPQGPASEGIQLPLLVVALSLHRWTLLHLAGVPAGFPSLPWWTTMAVPAADLSLRYCLWCLVDPFVPCDHGPVITDLWPHCFL